MSVVLIEGDMSDQKIESDLVGVRQSSNDVALTPPELPDFRTILDAQIPSNGNPFHRTESGFNPESPLDIPGEFGPGTDPAVLFEFVFFDELGIPRSPEEMNGLIEGLENSGMALPDPLAIVRDPELADLVRRLQTESFQPDGDGQTTYYYYEGTRYDQTKVDKILELTKKFGTAHTDMIRDGVWANADRYPHALSPLDLAIKNDKLDILIEKLEAWDRNPAAAGGVTFDKHNSAAFAGWVDGWVNLLM